ncbi:DUF1203 domain-containing protein [Streptomyces fuscichromogenes]|uniref:DUF1203 domain-containing protein n=1 Tax=Streptomyces fuscichromogenes TaxID=1324013 RepID=A0A917X8D7_9ACTN|nr:DUF1203 domain-containing protein [Streptomyces fuscichromogenes]GGM96261.1 hypothetical protein GCM10011578_016080 [Streptomyces fuscichromogenes]
MLDELRVRDDAGNRPRPYPDDTGGAPLRCCLRSSTAGERIALISYAPLRRWAAQTDADPGHLTGGRMLELPGDAQTAFAHALAEAFADPRTAQVHVRAVEYGCYHFRVDRP